MIEEFHYTIPWRASSPHPGAHASSQLGGGDEFAGLVPFASSPNPRNLDIRASLSDPFGQLAVRTFRQRSNIPVAVLADVSASMGFVGTGAALGQMVGERAADDAAADDDDPHAIGERHHR